jgi:DNA-binding NarL/FixJ family response regulator
VGKIQIAIADDHEIVRDGIIAMLEEYDHITVVGEAKCGEEVLSLFREDQSEIDLVIMDLNMGDVGGIEATRKIKKRFPDVKILALTMIKDEEKIREMIEAGASGYIFKNSGVEELVEAIEKVMDGELYFSDEAVFSIITRKKEDESEKQTGDADLTDRELEVLELICK